VVELQIFSESDRIVFFVQQIDLDEVVPFSDQNPVILPLLHSQLLLESSFQIYF